MKTNLHTLSAGILGLLLTFTGCSNEQEQMPETTGNHPMVFHIMHPSEQSATRATSTAFEVNDRVGIYVTGKDLPLEVSGNFVNNALLTYNGSQWASTKKLYWDDGIYNVYGYYPYIASLGSVDDAPFSVATDQQAAGGYEASDFLWANRTDISASNDKVSLQFRHRMSRLFIKLVKGEDYEGDELPTDAEVYIHSTVPDATIDLSVGVVTRNPHGTAQSIRARSLGNHTYAAILVPQRLDNRQPLVEVIMKGVSCLYESKFLFKPGIQHAVQLAISKNPEQIKIEIGGEIENWEQ